MNNPLEALLKVGDLDQARSLAEATLKQNPNDRNALVALAKLATFMGDFEKASESIARATLDGVEDTDSLLVRAAVAAQTKQDMAVAKALYERAIAEAKEPRAEPHFGLGLLLASAGQFKAAQKPLAKAVEIDPSVGQHHFHLARALMAEENIAEGLPHLEKAIELNPLYPPAYEACVFVLQEFGEAEAAEKLLREGLELMPGHPFLQTLLGNVLVAQGKVPEAMELTMKLAGEAPTDPSVLGNYARLLMGTGNRDAALALVREMEERGQATPQTHMVEAMLLEAQDPPDIDGAIAAYAAAARQDGSNWSALNNLAHLLMRREGEAEENLGAAAEALEEARARAPHRVEPLLNLSLVHARLQHTDEARALAQEVVERAGAADLELRQQAEKLLATLA